MKALLKRDNLFSILMGFSSSVLLKIESYWSLIILLTAKEKKEMNTLTIMDGIEMVAILVIFYILIAYIKRLKRKTEFLTSIVFLRSNRNISYDLAHTHKNHEEKSFDKLILSTGIPENTNINLLDYERESLIDYFTEIHKNTMTKSQVEKEITELYNEPFGYFK
jgi:hypothetical protein